MIEQVKQLERYLNAELTASLISSMFTLFITSDPNDNNIASAVDDSVEGRRADDKQHAAKCAPYARRRDL